MFKPTQTPAPGSHVLSYKGNLLSFVLILSEPMKGKAWLRTNLGNAEIYRLEICNAVENNSTPQHVDWHDIPMEKINETTFKLRVPLLEVGYFEAKAFFLSKNCDEPLWPEGINTTIKVDPANFCSANIIYNVFVRQFGINKNNRDLSEKIELSALQSMDSHNYTVIPPSGTFRDLIKDLDFIIGELGCRILQLLPIHPTPTVYGRMGRFGSPFAALDFYSVDAALAEFDRKSTPLEQFGELVDEIHARHAKIFLDIAINHTGWGSKLNEDHPEWFVRDDKGAVLSPGAWGVIWEDLAKLDYNHRGLWEYIVKVFITWCRRGVDGFRCDAGYKIPLPAWKYIVAKVRLEFPDTIFLLEGLGGAVSTTLDLLMEGNLNWAYSELFQNYSRSQIDQYLPQAIINSQNQGLMVHFAETHDNNRLAANSPGYAQMRTALSALTSVNGAYGFANGVEWFATEKIDVHGACSLNWGNSENQVPLISRLSKILSTHPAFQNGSSLRFLHVGEANSLALQRYNSTGDRTALVLLNLDHEQRNLLKWKIPKENSSDEKNYWDLISEKEISISGGDGCFFINLEPGEFLCLIPLQDRQNFSNVSSSTVTKVKDLNIHQCLKAKALEVFHHENGINSFLKTDVENLANQLHQNPIGFIRNFRRHQKENCIVTWTWPQDLTREVMIPPGFYLHLQAYKSFQIQLWDGDRVIRNESSLPEENGSHFIVIPPYSTPRIHIQFKIKITVFSPGNVEKAEGRLLYLSQIRNAKVLMKYSRETLLKRNLLVLGSNGRGGMMVSHVDWGTLSSRYDALLAGNLNPNFPEDRRIMLSRCRLWIVSKGYSGELSAECLDHVSQLRDSSAIWNYTVNIGNNTIITLTIRLEMIPDHNAIRIHFSRMPPTKKKRITAKKFPVRLVIRPDIEDRNFHDVTKAFLGPEHAWPNAMNNRDTGFLFSPSPKRTLAMKISHGRYHSKPEWDYMVPRPLENERGLHASSDLFSPGYFSVSLEENKNVLLSASIVDSRSQAETIFKENSKSPSIRETGKPFSETLDLRDALKIAINHFVVRRDDNKTVIAGYPWFLDWGRDTLICTRGMIAAGMLQDVKSILIQFALFEEQGTIPNMIRGNDTRNRDTSDAPLWFIIACSDIIRAEGNNQFLEMACGNRTILAVIESIVSSTIEGMPNGIYMDKNTGLVFSPSHFTWMDTNHPAGTPREGYPIEIQALWYNALEFSSKVLKKKNRWKSLAEKLMASILEYYYLENHGFLSDCLHAHPGQSPADAERDDALRSNQLLAITLGALRDAAHCRNVLSACQRLLIPGAIRSLADSRVDHPLPIVKDGQIINDPDYPYWGRYEGDEDSRRKPAYHNGTAWTWPFPSFSEAWYRVYGPAGRNTALAILGSSTKILNTGCINQVPEILDGNYPHQSRGCFAQAWGATELFRVLNLLEKPFDM